MNNKQDFLTMLDKFNNRTIFDNIERILIVVFSRYCSIYKDIKSVSLEKYNDEKTILKIVYGVGPNPIYDLKEIEYNIYNEDLAHMILDLFNLVNDDLFNQDLLLDYDNKNAFISLTKIDDITNKITFKINNKNYEFEVLNLKSDITRDLEKKLKNSTKPTAVFF